MLEGGADESERPTQLNLIADLSVRAKPSIKGHGADEEQKVGWQSGRQLVGMDEPVP